MSGPLVRARPARLANAASPLGRLGLVLGALSVLVACAPRTERLPNAVGGTITCSRYSPVMQTAILEAVVAGGGPGLVEVAGWMCGRAASESVRVVMLRYTPDDPAETPFLVPVLFEDGALVAFGWHLFEVQPHRYGPSPLPDRDDPWRLPTGWSGRRERPDRS